MQKLISIDIKSQFLLGGPYGNQESVGLLATKGVSYAYMIAGIVLVVTMIYSGLMMISGSGDSQQFERARMILTSAIIGFVIVVASWFIVRAVEFTTGMTILG